MLAKIPLKLGQTCAIKIENELPKKCDRKGGELRMGKKFILLSGTTLFALTLTFAGCGKKEEPAPPPPPPPAAPAPAPEPAAPAGGEMKAGDQAAPGGAEKAPEKKEEGKTK